MSGPAAKSKQIADSVEAKADKFRQGTPLPADAGFAGYPVKYFEKDPRDEYMQTRIALASNNNLRNKFGTTLPVTDKEIQYLTDQKTKEEKIIFDTWKYKTFQPGSDPVRQKYFEKIDPTWYKEREQEIERVFGLIEKLALLSLHSVRTPEDMVLVYGLQSGKIPMPKWQDYMPHEAIPVVAQGFGPEYISQGYWNPRKYLINQPVTAIPAAGLYNSAPLNVTSPSGIAGLDFNNPNRAGIGGGHDNAGMTAFFNTLAQ